MKKLLIGVLAATLATGSLVAPAFAGGVVTKPSVGGKCNMVKPYAGETGWVWTDGNCHHLDLTYDPGYKGDGSPATPTAPSTGQACTMTAPYAGQKGWVWNDGRCHLQKPGTSI